MLILSNSTIYYAYCVPGMEHALFCNNLSTTVKVGLSFTFCKNQKDEVILPKTQSLANYVLNACPFIIEFYKPNKGKLTDLPTSGPKALSDPASLDHERR